MKFSLITIKALLRRDEGQDLLEYALLVSLIAIAAWGGVNSVGTTINDFFWNTIPGMFQ